MPPEIYNMLRNLTLLFKRIYRKMHQIMGSPKVRNVIIIGSVAATAFIAGNYYQKVCVLNLRTIQNKPCLPLYGTASVCDYNKACKTTYVNTFGVNRAFLEGVKDLVRSSCDTASNFSLVSGVQAASPIIPVEPSKPNRVSQIMKYGFPGLDNIRSYEDFVVSYDNRNRVAHWVFEHLTKDSIKPNSEVDRSICEFKPDPSIHPLFRSENADYKRSGYDRGHLAAAGNHKSSQKTIEETFYLTNMAPQVGKGFNRDSWNRLEKYVRKLTKVYTNVYCCTGPLYLPKKESDGKLYVKYEVIGANHVAVPTHFYKVIVGETKDGELEMESYVMANEVIDDKISLENFQVPPRMIEKAAGLLFFSNTNIQKISKINGLPNK